MKSKNPHMSTTALGPSPVPGARYPFTPEESAKIAARKWMCTYCKLTGTLEEIRAVACSYVYPPCEYCGQTPECAINCAGIVAALGAPGVYVVGMKKPKLPSA
jgi:hypothetical protein